jgi:hypothetical protein
LQIALGTCTWSISYHVRPFSLTTVILCCSITCNITAGIIISIGDHKTRKKDVLEKMFRQELTKAAMKKVEKNRSAHLSHASTDEGLWSVVDEAAEGVEHDLKEKGKERGIEDAGGLSDKMDMDTEFETPLSNVIEGSGYMPIQGSSSTRQSIPRISTTTTVNNGPTSVSTTTTTHIS